MLQQWQRKGEPLPYTALCSVTSSSGTNPFLGLFVHIPCSGRWFRALVFLSRLRTEAGACARMCSVQLCSLGFFLFLFVEEIFHEQL